MRHEWARSNARLFRLFGITLQGRPQSAQTYCQKSTDAAESNISLPSLTAVSGVALLHIESRDIEKAVELWTLASQNPHIANSQWFEDVVGTYISTAAKELSPAALMAAQARGRELNMISTIQELWNEISENARLHSEPKMLDTAHAQPG